MSDGSPIKTFITGACAGLAEVRQALQGHPEIEIVGTAVEPGKADQKLASSGAQVILHGTARGDRLPSAEIDAIRHATAAPIILVTSGGAGALLHEALGAGISDVVMLPQLTDALVFTIKKTCQLAATRGGMQPSSLRTSTAEGRVLTVFSPKGGVGKTVLATSLATQIARRAGRRVLLVDLDLQFGDAAIMMGVEPEKTIYDLVMTTGELDPEKLAGYVISHPSGVDVVPAPVRPEDAELVAEDRVARLLDVAKETLRRDRRRHARVLPGDHAGDARPHRAPAARHAARHPGGQERQAHAADAQPPALPQGPHPPRAQPRPGARASWSAARWRRRST